MATFNIGAIREKIQLCNKNMQIMDEAIAKERRTQKEYADMIENPPPGTNYDPDAMRDAIRRSDVNIKNFEKVKKREMEYRRELQGMVGLLENRAKLMAEAQARIEVVRENRDGSNDRG